MFNALKMKYFEWNGIPIKKIYHKQDAPKEYIFKNGGWDPEVTPFHLDVVEISEKLFLHLLKISKKNHERKIQSNCWYGARFLDGYFRKKSISISIPKELLLGLSYTEDEKKILGAKIKKLSRPISPQLEARLGIKTYFGIELGKEYEGLKICLPENENINLSNIYAIWKMITPEEAHEAHHGKLKAKMEKLKKIFYEIAWNKYSRKMKSPKSFTEWTSALKNKIEYFFLENEKIITKIVWGADGAQYNRLGLYRGEWVGNFPSDISFSHDAYKINEKEFNQIIHES